MRVVVTGAGGLLGRAVVRHLAEDPEDQVVALDRQALDITDYGAVREAWLHFQPDAVINCAAYTAVDACEDDPEPAWAVNATGAAQVADACRETGAFLVHVSTDYVFDGTLDRPYTEFDRPNPRSVYGRTKDAGEQLVRARCPDHAIARAAWLQGVEGHCFVRTMLRLGRERDQLQVVEDQVGTPTFAFDLAPALDQLAMMRRPGTFHLAGSGTCTWFDLAREALRLAGIDTPVAPTDTASFGAKAPRPANSRLEGRHAAMVGIGALPPWQRSLERLVSDLEAVGA